MISAYLTQTAQWKKRTGQNRHAEPIYSDPITIKVRFEGKRRIVRDTKGHEILSEAYAFCIEDVQPGDILTCEGREWPVIAVSSKPDLSGKVSHREVAL
jgi:hypothetical protein